MRYKIHHTTTYTYNRPVTLAPHIIRLRPRCDVTQSLQSFSVEITPQPSQLFETVDLDGNNLLVAYFSDLPIDLFSVDVVSVVETFRSNPFAYLLEPWATHLPINYPAALEAQLQPYLLGGATNFPHPDPVAVQLAHELWHTSGGNPISFLWELNQKIYHRCKHMVRDTGDPLPPGITWTGKTGSCRDVAVLFMEVCRAIGLAARFVSGYQEGDPDSDDRHLHAWAEVYLPGAGWRGYDPTQGLVVSDRHIALASSPSSPQAAPISGALKTGIGAKTTLEYHLSIKVV
ncbi:MAG TPA: transglutaminase family protein [Synechococcales cyanobacterium M55_K2018_004]|nr:transglutaminase family protein [Synechococcales cyanobacterium M55_K2018_004]